jgi:hypothetical protein
VPITVKYTWNGDGNLDGKINADDYFLIDSGFLAPPDEPLYRHGDFNFDDRIDADDYFLIDSAFLGQAGTLASPSTRIQLATVRSRAPAADEDGRRIRRDVGEPVFNPARRTRRPAIRR